MVNANKPLGHKNYGSIGHLPDSRLGDGDHHVAEGQARICLNKARDRHDTIIVQEKVDGSNVGIAMHQGKLIALGRAGYLAQTSKYEMHQLFADWVRKNEGRFTWLLEGMRVVGEWLAYAHGTRYRLPHEPFVPFDIMIGQNRMTYNKFIKNIARTGLVTPKLISYGAPCSIKRAMQGVEESGHGALDPVEGAVWRVERSGKVDFLAKYVRPDKVDGIYLEKDIWNWKPGEDTYERENI